MDVTARYYEDEDHFLFFSSRERVMQDIADWMKLPDEARAETAPLAVTEVGDNRTYLLVS